MSIVIVAIAAGLSAGAVTLLLAHFAPWLGAGSFVRDIDRPVLFGGVVTRREAHLVGIAVHLGCSAVFGGAFGLLVQLNLLPGFGYLWALAWGMALTAIIGAIVLPLEGHGFFGWNEDAWFPVDLLLSSVFWSLLFAWLVRLWLGAV